MMIRLNFFLFFLKFFLVEIRKLVKYVKKSAINLKVSFLIEFWLNSSLMGSNIP